MIEPRTNPTHLYRALLRECTYLPDSRARTFFHNYTVSSFRNFLPKDKSWRRKIPLEEQVRLLDRGRKELSRLRRANEGYLKPLEKVLMITYGRVGKRRRQLMSNLMHQDPAQTGREVGSEPAIEPYTKNWMPPTIIQTLMRSQKAHEGQLDRVNTRIKLKLQIPEETIWKKPLSSKRVVNATRQWYVKNADVILPPLPEKEWLELLGKADGTTPWSGPVKKRTPAAGLEVSSKSTGTPEVLLSGPERGDTFKKYVDGRPHRITRRLMRRLWAVILTHTPMVAMNEATGKLVVHWEKPEKSSPRVIATSQEQTSTLFGG